MGAMAEAQKEPSAIEKLLQLRREETRIVGEPGPENILKLILSLLGAPEELPGFRQITENVLKILDPGTGVPIAEDKQIHVTG